MSIVERVWGTVVVAMLAGGCGSSGLTSPTPVTTADSVVVVSGVTGHLAVPGARVTFAGVSYTTNATGRFEPPESAFMVDQPIDVEAPGFLPRRTTLLRGQRAVTLWPVESQEEADAVRQMVYRRGHPEGEVFNGYPPGGEYMISMSGAPAAVVAAWTTTVKDACKNAGLQCAVYPTFQYETFEIDVRFSDTCTAPSGICKVASSYDVRIVRPDLALDKPTMRRVVASWFLGTNPLPGLMSERAPADDFSQLELRSIQVMAQRMKRNAWPDSDR